MKALKVLTVCITMSLSHNILALDFSGSGHEYLENVSHTNPFMKGMAAGTVSTILSTLYYEGLVCTPKKVTNIQFTSAVNKFLTDHPERLHEQIYVLGADALVSAYPCEENEFAMQ